MITPGKTMMTNSPPFQTLKRKLWLGTLLTDLLFVSAIWYFWPSHLHSAITGVAMGLFYLWSLMFSAEYPKRAVQSVFSLIRVGFLAYLVVKLSGLKIPDLAIVMCGLLSYKLMLTVEYVVQALPAFRHLSGKRLFPSHK
jgi:hypothetical protein